MDRIIYKILRCFRLLSCFGMLFVKKFFCKYLGISNKCVVEN